MTVPDLIILDNDGVLVDTEGIANRILASLLSSYGLPTTYEDSVRRFLGTSLAYVREASEDDLGRTLPADFEATYHGRLFASIADDLRAIPDVRVAVEGIPMAFCVASSGSMERIEKTLRMAELWDLFEGRAYSAETVGKSKPAPDLFLAAAEAEGHAPGRCAVIEDSPWGIEAANRAGMTSWGFSYRTPESRLGEATGGVLRSMRELRRVWEGEARRLGSAP